MDALTHEVRLEELRPFYQRLIRALGDAGVGGTRLGEILEQAVSAECKQCGATVNGTALTEAMTGTADTKTLKPKVARLRDGYCAKSGCPSHYYQLRFTPVEGLDWAGVVSNAAQAQPEPDFTGEPVEVQPPRPSVWLAPWSSFRVRAGVAVLVVFIAFWVGRHWWYTGTLPGLPAQSKYRVDPTSIPPEFATPRQ